MMKRIIIILLVIFITSFQYSRTYAAPANTIEFETSFSDILTEDSSSAKDCISSDQKRGYLTYSLIYDFGLSVVNEIQKYKLGDILANCPYIGYKDSHLVIFGYADALALVFFYEPHSNLGWCYPMEGSTYTDRGAEYQISGIVDEYYKTNSIDIQNAGKLFQELFDLSHK